LDENGTKKSANKKDLDSLLDHLNIQVDNPVAVLDQEEAKKFLTGKPEDKYNFFTKATELERIDRTYAAGKDSIEEYSEQSDKMRLSVRPQRDKVNELERKWEEYKELDKIEERLAEQRMNYVWSYWKNLSDEVKDKDKVHNDRMKKMHRRREDFEEFRRTAETKNPEEETIAEKIKELTAEAEKAAEEKQSLDTQLRATKAPLQTQKSALKSCKREQNGAKKKLESAKRRLQKTREDAAKTAGNAEGEQAARAKKMIDLERAIDENKSEEAIVKPKITALFQRYEGMEPAMQQCREDSTSASRQLSAVKRKLQDLHSDSGSGNIAVFGEKCAEMHRRVEREQRFEGRVVGPIGAHLKIRSGAEKFSKLAESAISGLDKFICTSNHDRALLTRIRTEVGCNPRQCNIYQHHVSPRYSVQEESFEEGIEMLSNVLAIEDDLVYNCLVDNQKIDMRALAVSKEVSEIGLLTTDGSGRECIKGNIQFVHFFAAGRSLESK